jgi:ribosomal protein S18 acetylase RimI-like enzyme
VRAEIREYRIHDADAIVGLWNGCLPADPITRELFEERVLLDPNFDLAGCRVAESGGRVVGFAHALVRRTPLPWGFESVFERDRGVGWIFAVLVANALRRHGIGSMLMGQAQNYLRASGAHTVVLGDYPPNYLLSGVDAKAYPGALQFFERRGFTVVGKSFGMRVSLAEFRAPSGVAEIERRLAHAGIVVEHFRSDYLLPTIAFLRECFPTWLCLFTDKLRRGHSLDEMVIARQGEEVVGYCQHHYWPHIGRTGPFGAKAALRRQGIGTVMLCHLLERMAGKGLEFGWFAQTGERQVPFYERVGYRVNRTQLSMAKQL